jgi:hypothetical protein
MERLVRRLGSHELPTPKKAAACNQQTGHGVRVSRVNSDSVNVEVRHFSKSDFDELSR